MGSTPDNSTLEQVMADNEQLSEASLRSLFETMALGVVFQDATGRITVANPSAERILGLSLEQLLGRTSLDPRWKIIRDDGTDLPGTEHPAMIALRTCLPVRDVVIGVFTPAEDQYRWLLVNAIPEFRSGETAPWRVFVTFNDITERCAAEAALHDSEERYRTLFESMHEGFALHDVICNDLGEPVDYRYLDINPAFERLTGLRRETTVGRRVREVIPGIEDHWIRTFGNVALTGEPAEVENYVQELDRYYRAKAYSPERGEFAVVFEEVTQQRKLLRDLQKREAELSVLFESSQAGIIMVDPAGMITMSNHRMAEMFGCSLEEIVGSRYPDLVHPDQRGAGDERMRQLIAGIIDHVSSERHYIRKDGSDFWGYLSGRRHEDTDGGLLSLVGHITDITDLKNAEQTLQEKERYLQTIIDASPECIKLLASDGSLLMMNRSGLRMIEADSLEQVKGKYMSALVVERDRPMFEALTSKVFNGESTMLEFEAMSLRGSSIWLETHAVPFRNANNDIIALLGLTRDITERKRAIDKLQQSEERFRSIMALSPDIISIISETGELIYNSPAALNIHGYNQEEMIGLNTFELIHPDDQGPINSVFQEILANPGQIKTAQFRYQNKDGSYVWMECCACNQLANPHINGIIAVSRNIQERKQLEEEHLILEKQLLHAQKLESLGVLAGGIAHDFNNILTAIIGNAELALMRLNPESPAMENLQRIEKAAARAADLARQMLAYSGKGKFVVEHIDLNRLVEEMGHMLEVSISKKAVLRYNLTKPLPAISVDATQIRQIIMNLVINASEAIGDTSGVIAITTGCLECNVDYLQKFWLTDPIPAGLYVSLEIADTGCGMDKETLSRIFDPFFTTKFTGRGLGMAAVLGIVRGHKGAIKVNSVPGKGSSFKVLLPAGEKPAELFNGHVSVDLGGRIGDDV